MLRILSAPGYWASSDGEIWRDATRRLRPTSNGKGYLRVTVSINGNPSTRYVHRLVAEAYHGPCPPGWEARHLNGMRNDNRPKNLAWSDKLTNEAFSTRRKFSEDQVREIRRRAQTESKKAIAKDYGVVPSAISVIVSGRTYGHVK